MVPLEYNDHPAVRAGGDTGGQVFQLVPRQDLSIGRVSCHNKLLGGCPDPAIGADHDAVVLDDAAIDASLGQRLTIGPQNRHNGPPSQTTKTSSDLVNSPSATLQNQLASDSAFVHRPASDRRQQASKGRGSASYSTHF